jgi:hypothetical protein
MQLQQLLSVIIKDVMFSVINRDVVFWEKWSCKHGYDDARMVIISSLRIVLLNSVVYVKAVSQCCI